MQGDLEPTCVQGNTKKNPLLFPLMLRAAQLSVDHDAYSKLYLFSRLHSHNRLREDVRA